MVNIFDMGGFGLELSEIFISTINLSIFYQKVCAFNC